jgi:hypothetical protein
MPFRQENRSDHLTFLRARDWDFRSDQGNSRRIRIVRRAVKIRIGGEDPTHFGVTGARAARYRTNSRADDVFVRVSQQEPNVPLMSNGLMIIELLSLVLKMSSIVHSS